MDKSLKIALILSAVDKASRVVDSASKKMQRSLNSFGNVATVAGGLGTVFFTKAILAAEESETAVARVRQVFKSMGEDYKTATSQAEAYASSLQTQIGVEDELIMLAQAKLATFNKAANAQARANGIFNRATEAAFNMQAAGFGDASNNIVQLGKALQDPITGINALRRSGITFTDAEKKKIAVLVKSNKTFEAQNIVMKSIEKQVGGVARETANQSAKMRVAWGEIQETIGKKLLPAFVKLGNYIINVVVPKVQAFVDKHPALVKWMAIASVTLLGLGVAAKVVAFILPGLTFALKAVRIALMVTGTALRVLTALFLTNPIGLIITAIATAVYLIIRHWKKITAFFRNLWAGIKKIFAAAGRFILNVALAPLRMLIFAWTKITAFFAWLWDKIKTFATDAWNAIGNAITAPIRWIKEKWEALKNWFKNLWSGIKNTVNDMFTAPDKKVAQMRDKIMQNMDKFKQLNPVLQKHLQNAVMDNLPQSPAKKGPLKNLHKVKIMETLATAINANPLTKAMQGALGASVNSPSPVPVAARSGGGSVVLNYNPTISMGGGNATDIRALLKQHAGEIKKIVDEATRKRDRTKF